MNTKETAAKIKALGLLAKEEKIEEILAEQARQDEENVLHSLVVLFDITKYDYIVHKCKRLEVMDIANCVRDALKENHTHTTHDIEVANK